MRCLLAIDDTDNLESRGTGSRARELGARLGEAGFGRVRGITRHQLYVHPSIPYTSHNSSACLDLDLADGRTVEALADFGRDYLAEASAEGSDAGLCVARYDEIDETLLEWGRQAKRIVLTRERAHELAAERGVHLEGVTGTRIGVIGALAAVGLRRGGHDGRFLWLKGVRELTGTWTVGALLASTDIDAVESIDGQPLAPESEVVVDPWPRPVLLHGRAVLLTEPNGDEKNGSSGWRLLPKETIRRY
jgi:Predicted DNA-binding protein containing a Zn-ribbon domain